MAMAVVTSGYVRSDIWFAQRHGFAVVRVTIMREPVLVAAAATLVADHLEMSVLRGFDLMGGMAVGADGCAFVSLAQQLAMHALVVGLLDPDVTFAACFGHV